MVDKSQAVNDLRYLATRLAGIIAILPDLEKLDSLDKGVKQAEAEKAKASGALAEINKQVEAAKAEHVETRAHTSGLVKDTTDHVQSRLNEAKSKAADVVAKAQAEADKIKEAAERSVSEAKAAVQAELKTHTDLKATTASLTASRDDIVKEIEKLKAKF